MLQSTLFKYLVMAGDFDTSKAHLMLCRFIVPEDKTEEFEATWRERETNMQHLPGFMGFNLDKQQGTEYTVTSK